MNEPDRNNLGQSPLEDVLARALDALETGGEAALEQVLAAHPSQAPQLREALADLRGTDLLSAPSAAMPAQLGEFRIRSQLGAGGMGVVYLAEQTSLLREVALKVVRPELLFFEGARERFRREIEVVARLEHPAIVPILATGSADGIPYYAMPRIRGRSAEAVLKLLAERTPDDLTGADLRAVLADAMHTHGSDIDSTFAGTWWQAVVRLVRKAAFGIHHAHTRGVLHRDLKPSNLMLTADGQAIVLDFGLAHAHGDQKLTRTGAAAGSPAYMAPEQVRGEPADERTDVYGLAATLHCLLALRPPFVIDDPEALRSQILAGMRQDLPMHSSMPTELRLVLDTAMEVDRLRRYASATNFADDLQAVLDGRPIQARRLPMRVRVQRYVGRHRVLATAVAALIVFVVVLPTVLLWQQQQANALLSDQVQRSDRSAKVSVDAVEKLLAAVARDRMLHVPAAQAVAAEMLHGAIELFDELAADTAQVERVHGLRIRAYLWLAQVESARGRYDDAVLHAQRANDLWVDGELPPDARLQKVIARRILAGLFLDTNRHAEAEAISKTLMAVLEPLVALPSLRQQANAEIAHVHHYAAVLAAKRDDAEAREEALRKCIAAYEQTEDQLAIAGAQINLSQFLKQKRPGEALQFAEAAIRIATAPDVSHQGWPVPQRVEASARREQAALLKLLGREAEAIEAFTLALHAFDQFLNTYPEEPTARISRGAIANDLGLIHLDHGDWAAARPLLEAACQDQTEVLTKQPRNVMAQRCLAEHRRSLSRCLHEMGDFGALESVARTLGKMEGGPLLSLNAARSLLRCAEAAEPDRAAQLRVEALDLLVETKRRGRILVVDDPLYAPLRNEPRFQQLATPKSGG